MNRASKEQAVCPSALGPGRALIKHLRLGQHR